MLEKKQRLKTSFFKKVVGGGEKHILSASSPLFLMKKYKTKESENGCAVVVSIKTAKNAVERNRIRRIAYKELSQHNVCDKKGYGYVIIASSRAAKKSREELKNNIKKLFTYDRPV